MIHRPEPTRNIRGNSIQEVWYYLLEELTQRPEHHVRPRDAGTLEITGMRLFISDWRNNIIVHPVRNLNYRFMVAEWLWVAFGLEAVDILTQYNGQMSRFSDDGKTLAGAYGPRLMTQWRYVIETLRADRNSRQAVATIWTPNPEKSKDIPCTIALQFLVRNNQLNLIVTMRSSDTWLGIPYDVFTFSMLANCIAGTLRLDPGYLMMQLGSSHLYDDNLYKAQQVLLHPELLPGASSPMLHSFPPFDLEKILESPGRKDTLMLDEPWLAYAKALGSNTWSEAFDHLVSINRER